MKTGDEIFAAMCGEYERICQRGVADAGDMAVRMRAAAAEISSLYVYADWIMREAFPQTADGVYLDRHAQMRGIARNAPTKARGTMRFSVGQASQTDTAVPAGTVCLNAAGDEFMTVEDSAILAGEMFCEVTAVAAVAGKSANVPSGTVVFMTNAPAGVKACTNVTAFAGGTDEESDESLRERVLSSYRTLPNGANAAYYEKSAREVDGVASVVVKGKNRGIGTVDVIISAEDGMPTDELISAVSEKLNASREICVDVAVLAPDAVTVNVDVKVDTEIGYDAAEVLDKVSTAVRAFFDGNLLGKSVLVAKLGSVIYGVEGVKNYKISAPTADISVTESELPVLGNLNVRQWG